MLKKKLKISKRELFVISDVSNKTPLGCIGLRKMKLFDGKLRWWIVHLILGDIVKYNYIFPNNDRKVFNQRRIVLELYTHILSVAKNRKIKILRVGTAFWNKPVIVLAKRYGFKIIGTDKIGYFLEKTL